MHISLSVIGHAIYVSEVNPMEARGNLASREFPPSSVYFDLYFCIVCVGMAPVFGFYGLIPVGWGGPGFR